MLFFQETNEALPPTEEPPPPKKRRTARKKLDDENVSKMLEESIRDDGEDTTTPQENDIENGEMDTKEKCERKYNLFEKAIEKHQRKIIFLTSKQGEILLKIKDLCAKEGRMIGYFIYLEKFKLNESTANLKIRIAELVKEFPKLEKTNLSLNIVNKYMKQIRSICENSGEKYM